MQCKEATSLIIPFIERELPEDKLKIFLEHNKYRHIKGGEATKRKYSLG